MFELFTEPARQAVRASNDTAIALGHDFIGTEHMLLALADTPGGASDLLRAHGVDPAQAREVTIRLLTEAGVPANGGQAARDALASIGIDVDEVQRHADANFGPGAFRFPRPAFTPRARKALEHTAHEAKSLGHQHIDTEHLLIGLLDDSAALATRILVALDVEPAPLRDAARAHAQRAAGS
ncbi:hypothetical protein GCM10029964_035080 [Kibdelosporangium lantanae]